MMQLKRNCVWAWQYASPAADSMAIRLRRTTAAAQHAYTYQGLSVQVALSIQSDAVHPAEHTAVAIYNCRV
jgi:hypothetical protein